MPESTALTISTPDELIKIILRTEESPQIIIPDDIDDETLCKYADRISEDLARATNAVERIRPFMGRILLLFKQRPDLYHQLGYTTWDEWMSNGVRKLYNIPRGDAYDCITIAEQLPDLTVPQLKELGMNRLKVLSKVVKRANKGVTTIEMKQSNTAKWVALATENTALGLAKLAEEQNVISPSEVEALVPLSFGVSKDFKEEFEAFKNDVDIRQYVMQEAGAFSDEALLKSLVSEASTEWKAQIADQTRSSAAE